MSYFAIAVKGGYIMIVLAALSVVAMAIIIEKFLTLKKMKREKKDFLIEFEKAAQEKDAQRAKQLCQAVDTIPVARVFANILKAKDGDLHNWEQTISAGTQKELHLMEKGLGTLSTIAAVGPLFGFMGTVLGMIKGEFGKFITTRGRACCRHLSSEFLQNSSKNRLRSGRSARKS